MPIQEANAADSLLDRTAIAACIGGDSRAFESIVGRYQSRIARQMWHYTRDRLEHEMLVQEVFIEAYKSLEGYTGTAPLEHWLARIGARTGYRYWRRKKKDQAVAEAAAEYWTHRLAGATEREEPSEAAECLFDLLKRLSPEDRAVLTCIYFEACTVEEAADRLGWNSTLVKVRAFRARRRLRKWLEEAGYGPKE